MKPTTIANNKKLPESRNAATSPVVRMDSMMAPPIVLLDAPARLAAAAAASSSRAQASSSSAKKEGLFAARNSLATLVIVSRFNGRPRSFMTFVK